MQRPSKEAVDRAVEHYYEDSQCAIERSALALLAAEVVALRAENAELTKQNAYAWSDGFNSASAGLAQNEQEELLAPYKATLARVEALPAKWRAEYEASGHDHELLSCPSCADDLEAALKGEP